MNSPDFSKKNNSRGAAGFRVIQGADKPELGRTPPHSLEAEEYLLSCCFLDGAPIMAQCIEAGLTATSFYFTASQIIYARLLDMHDRELSIDLAVLAEELKKSHELSEVGGYEYLATISGRVPTTMQSLYFVEKVRELWGLRELIKFSTGVVEQCYAFDGELPDMVNASRCKLERMYDWASAATRGRGVSQAQAATQAAEDAIAGRVDKSRWLTWGIPGFDELFGCFDANNEDWHVVIAGLRSQGKSSLARQIAVANLERGKKGVVFNLETGAKGWLLRAASHRARVNLRTVGSDPRKERIEKFRACVKEQEAWMGERLWIFDDVFTVDELEVKVREIHRACGGLDFIVVDYLQLLSLARLPKGMNREQQVAEISRRLLLLGKKLNITCFILAQLSRKSTGDGKPRRPQVSDLRESGQIENDASRVIMLYVLPEGKAGPQDESTTMPECEIIQGKYKNGQTGYELVVFEKPYVLFVPPVARGDVRPGAVASKSGFGREGKS